MDGSDCRGHYLKQAFERDFSGRDNGAAGSDLGRMYP